MRIVVAALVVIMAVIGRADVLLDLRGGRDTSGRSSDSIRHSHPKLTQADPMIFDGTNHIEVPATGTDTTDLTVHAEVRCHRKGRHPILADGLTSWNFMFYVDWNGPGVSLDGSLTNTGSENSPRKGGVEMTVGVWYNATWVWNRNARSVTTYVNGAMVAQTITRTHESEIPKKASEGYTIGQNKDAQMFQGEMRHIVVLNDALTPKEVGQMSSPGVTSHDLHHLLHRRRHHCGRHGLTPKWIFTGVLFILVVAVMFGVGYQLRKCRAEAAKCKQQQKTDPVIVVSATEVEGIALLKSCV